MTVPTLNEMEAMDDIELTTHDVPADEIARWTQHDTCNGFAFDYLEAHDDHDVVVRDALIEGGDVAHCFVVDHTRNVTIDVTLGQFNVGPSIGVWDGTEHPHEVDHEPANEWTSRESFESHYADETHSDFIL
jgi:hypothetical protein